MEKNLKNLRYLEKLKKHLKKAEVNKKNICITGSAPLAIYGVKDNKDLDFIATKDARKKLETYAKSSVDCKISNEYGEKGKVFFEKDVHTSRYDRYNTLGLTDKELVNNQECHFKIEGYKILRPEITLSLKVLDRREKDLKHIRLIEQSGLFELVEWDWGRVILVPPWNRPKDSLYKKARTKFREGLEALRKEGLAFTLLKTVDFFSREVFSWNTKLVLWKKNNIELEPPLEKNKRYDLPLPNLLSRQYNADGEFIRYDLLHAINQKYIEKKDSELIINPDMKITSNINILAHKIKQFSKDLPEKAFEIKVKSHVKTSSVTYMDEAIAQAEYGKEKTSQLVESKKNLLRESGAAFHAILWPGMKEYFDIGKEMLKREFDLIDIKKYRLDKDFSDFVQDVYKFDRRNEKWLRETKIHHLLKFEPVVEVVSFEVPNPAFVMKGGQKVEKNVYDLKMRIRKKIYSLQEDYVYATDIHTTDNFQNNAHLEHVLTKIEKDRYEKN